MQRHDLPEAETLLPRRWKPTTSIRKPIGNMPPFLAAWLRERALSQLDDAIELAGDDPALLVRRAEWHLALSNLAAAQADAEAALAPTPTLRPPGCCGRACYRKSRKKRSPRIIASWRSSRTIVKRYSRKPNSIGRSPPASPEASTAVQRALMTVQALLDTYHRRRTDADAPSGGANPFAAGPI